MSHLRLKRRLRCALAAFALVALRAFGRSWAQNAQRPTPFGQVASSHSHSRVGTRAWVLIHPFIDTHTLDPVAGPPCVGTAPSPSLPPLGWPLPSRKPMHAAGVQTTVLSGFCFTTIQNSFVRPTTWRYPWASEMADAARPTHRPHARTPLTRVRTHNSQ